MNLPGLDGSFDGIGMVNVQWDELEVNIVFLECFFEFMGAFVAQYVYLRSISIYLKFTVQAGPSFAELSSGSGLERRGEDGVAILFIQDHDVVVVATGGLDWELSCLVRERFSEVGGLHNGEKYGLGSFLLRFLGRAEIEGRLFVEVGCYFGLLYVLLLRAEMAFAGSERLGAVFGDEGSSQAGPRVEMGSFDGS